MNAIVSCTTTVESDSGDSRAATVFPDSSSLASIKATGGRPPGPGRPRDQIIAAIKSYAAGELMRDIAVRFGVTQPTVTYWVEKYGPRYGGPGFVRRKPGRRAERHPSSRDMAIMFRVINGSSFSEIAREYGISRARVGFIVKTWEQRGFVARPPKSTGEQAGDLPASPIHRTQPIQP